MIKRNRYVIFDLEMPGTVGDKISAVAYIVLDHGVVTKTFYSLVNPNALFDPYVISMTHISEKKVENRPTFSELWEKIKQDFEDSILVAHNAQGDICTLLKTLAHYKISFDGDINYICTLDLASSLLPHLEHFSLDFLCEKIGFESLNHHNALSDAEGCLALFLYFDKICRKSVDAFQKKYNKLAIKKTKPATFDLVRAELEKSASPMCKRARLNENPTFDESYVIGVPKEKLQKIAMNLVRDQREKDRYLANFENYEYYEERLLMAFLISATRSKRIRHFYRFKLAPFNSEIEHILKSNWSKPRKNF